MKIMVAYFPSREGEAALQRAIEEARLQDAQLLLARHLTVSNDDDAVTVLPSREELDRLVAEVRQRGVECDARWSTGTGPASTHLLRTAEQEDVDLIVLGIRRRSPVGKLILGSTSQDILLGADCPVLAVKAPTDG